MKKRVGSLNTAKRVRRVQADTDRVLKCISESGGSNVQYIFPGTPDTGSGYRGFFPVPDEVCVVTYA